MPHHKTFFLLLAVPLLLGACSASSDSSPSAVDMIADTDVNSGTPSMAYAIGDVGPGGGIVFITPDTKGNMTGRYYEAAPRNGFWREAEWCDNTTTLLGASGTSIGTGESNTTIADTTCTFGAIQIASDYTNNGISDWFLPSKDELSEMYTNRIPGLYAYGYWSSSEFGVVGSAWTHRVYSDKNTMHYVRPVRSFS